ncbi:MAG: hypothetical protein ABI120_07310 [Gemmatimonadaceae bacterium]
MTHKDTPDSDDATEATATVRRQLTAARDDLLRVHRALLHVERLRYEKVHGRIANNGLFLQLAIGDPWFDWLRPMGQMVLLIDERMEDKDAPLGVSEADALLSRSRELLRADAQGDAFQRLYFQALQLSPELAVLHGQVSKTHRPSGPEAPRPN